MRRVSSAEATADGGESARQPGAAATRPVVPGPTGGDMLRAMRGIRRDPIAFLAETAERHGDLVGFPVPGPPAVLLNDPADVARVLRTASRSWSKDTRQWSALAEVTGPGLLASDQPAWITRRRAAAPAFHHQRLEALGADVVEAADSAVHAHLAGHRTGPVDVAVLTHQVGLDVVGRLLFSQDLSGHATSVLRATSAGSEAIVRSARSMLPLPRWAPTLANLRLRSARRRLTAATAAIIERRHVDTQGRGAASYGDDLLGLLLDGGLTDAEVGDELATMVVAGHETVASALTWTLMLLAEHPEVQDRVAQEVAALDGPPSLLGHQATLPWTRAAVDEALRLYPPAWLISRRAREPVTLGGQQFPAGTLAIISPFVLQRRAQHWPDPLTFDPQRFLGSGGRHTAYLPFGDGPRLCIGRELALGEMVVVLTRLVARFRVEVPDGWVRPRYEIGAAIHPHGGMPLVLRSTT
ncbi:cytochrome P450 [Nocardioides sp. CFH 31398]|uniref:cytochrome P450 n=1 Tax=Nocardioides sp. CFH 31398 TaxID=2919579 RepID=UPI001F06E01C|nr:cytochrome P450 [Nocardioides sp. CFH 31398]MCH1866215.1 cytochrome P450 [Nocardioides sp. CFH 31398]